MQARRLNLFVFSVLLLCRLGLAQDPSSSHPVSPVKATEIDDIGLPTRYLEDENGKLVPVPGISYERFRELLQLESRAGALTDPPAIEIEKLAIEGSADNKVARLDVAVTLRTQKSGWNIVPLRMQNAVLRAALSVQEGFPIVHRFDAKEGHKIWIQGKADKSCTLKMPLIVRLKQQGAEQQLPLQLPPASVCEVVLRVPANVDDAILREGEGIVTNSLEANDQTTIYVAGAAGDLLLAWQRRESKITQTALQEVTAEISARIETQDLARFEATIQIAKTAEAKEFFVRLPPHAEWIPQTTRGYVVNEALAAELAPFGTVSSMETGQIIKAVFDHELPNVEFTLAATYSPAKERADSALELGGFEVLGRRRQTGIVTITLQPGWSLTAATNRNIFRSDDAAASGALPIVAQHFRFVRQPFSLRVEAMPQPTRTVVEPVYAAVVENSRITLAGTLRYQTRGPRPETFTVDLHGWDLDRVGPVELVSIDSTGDDKAVLRIQPTATPEFTLQLEMHQDVSKDALEIGFDLPTAVATQALPARLAVSTSESISLTPAIEDMHALALEEQEDVITPLEDMGARPQVYRELPSAQETPHFAAALKVRKRRVSAELNATATLSGKQAFILQQMHLNVSFEPLQQLIVETTVDGDGFVPRAFVNERPVVVRETSPSIAAAEKPEGTQRWQVDLGVPAVGPILLAFQYTVPIMEEGSSIPLLVPAASESVFVTRQTVALHSKVAQKFEFANSLVRDPSITIATVNDGIELTSPTSLRAVGFTSLKPGPQGDQHWQIERAWFQTWLAPTLRRERYVAKVVGLGDKIQLLLPDEEIRDDVRLLVDGQPAQAITRRGNAIEVVLPANESLAPQVATHTIELWYIVSDRIENFLPMQLNVALPELKGAGMPGQTMVEVITPANLQLLQASNDLLSEQSWRKRSIFWERESRLSTTELEDWAGAMHADTWDADSRRQLFTTFDSPRSVTFIVCPRRWLWFSTALLLAFAYVGLHLLNRWAGKMVFALLAALLLALALLAPEAAMCMTQPGGIGCLLLAALAWSGKFRTASTRDRSSAISPRGDSNRDASVKSVRPASAGLFETERLARELPQ